MQVIDHEPASWILVLHGPSLLLDVNCSHSCVSYSFLLQLNEAEAALYAERGRDYLHDLAHAIHHSAPGVAASHSPYKARNVDRVFGTEVMAAIQASRGAQGA